MRGIIAYSLLRQSDSHGRHASSSTTGMVCNIFDNHIRLDYTVATSTYILAIMALVYVEHEALMHPLTTVIVESACTIANTIKARALFVYADVIQDYPIPSGMLGGDGHHPRDAGGQYHRTER